MSKVHLEDISPSNWREDLRVSEIQQKFVSNPYRLLARAYAYRESRSQAKMIYVQHIAVGMLMFYDWEKGLAYDFSQLFIDERYQGKGYGEEAARLAIGLMKQDGRYKKIVLCYIEGNEIARVLYEKLGFQHTGERDGDEIIMSLSLT